MPGVRKRELKEALRTPVILVSMLSLPVGLFAGIHADSKSAWMIVLIALAFLTAACTTKSQGAKALARIFGMAWAALALIFVLHTGLYWP